ncbi:hypothetical protein T4B_4426 [Trichinella pseudospiralis]|uniref:Uncharacterized protein n=1 Tax=Trichinella pseudospiralis TaxID=6337 RepID=A0A0V1I3K9_TRIPS|nr:hypothetical protein T4B_4426 [Trichinella pseudospiralis]
MLAFLDFLVFVLRCVGGGIYNIVIVLDGFGVAGFIMKSGFKLQCMILPLPLVSSGLEFMLTYVMFWFRSFVSDTFPAVQLNREEFWQIFQIPFYMCYY